MKTFSAAALDALERGDAIVSAALAIYGTPAIFLWGGYGDLQLAGDTGTETYKGIGDRGLVKVSSGQIGGAAQGITLVLSGVEPEVLDVLDADEVKSAAVVLRRLIFDSTGKTLLGAHVFTRGRVDRLDTPETIGGTAAIQLSVESAARGLGRRGGRLRSDADQRLINPSDGFFKFVAYASEKTLYWGGKRPARAGDALGTHPGGGGWGSGMNDGFNTVHR